MNACSPLTPMSARFPGTDTQRSLVGPALRFLVVLGLHAALVVWLLHVRQDLPELRLPERVFVRLVEATAAAPETPPEPVIEQPPQPVAPAVRAPAPVKPPVRRAVRDSESRPPPALPQALESRMPAPRAVPVVTEARFDADYLNNPPPVYPVLSRRRGEQGKVLLLVQVSAQGTAERVEIHAGSGHARLDSAALEAVKRWRFVPARRGDAAVAASVVVPVVFRLGSE